VAELNFWQPDLVERIREARERFQSQSRARGLLAPKGEVRRRFGSL
jgi:hypothetical protein